MHDGQWKVEKAAWPEGLKCRCHKNAEQGIQWPGKKQEGIPQCLKLEKVYPSEGLEVGSSWGGEAGRGLREGPRVVRSWTTLHSLLYTQGIRLKPKVRFRRELGDLEKTSQAGYSEFCTKLQCVWLGVVKDCSDIYADNLQEFFVNV